MKKSYKLYFHRDPINNEVMYVGIGTAKYRHTNMHERNFLWKDYVNKRGIPKVEVIHDNLTELEALILEAEYIAQYGKLIDRTGTLTNLADGGQAGNAGVKWTKEQNEARSKSSTGRKRSEATRQKMREAKLGTKWSKERCKAQSKRKIGIKQPNISKALLGKKHSLESRVKRMISIIQMDKDGNVIAEHRSIREAAKSIGRDEGALSNAVNGKQKTCAGYVWKRA